ncbi:MAG TPA: NAD(P)H-hydrate dehydratase [Deltaproteobacteria bacterium]|jgi:NAD(P)H-hydrate epimerase|nr:NAD(P)H-hydrate dehydratase [Deltaproteobacteria bacterium]HOD70231.1 NAD(P)H-hydrate dehydratase [Deltaproteobacteria bacterium]HOE72510.1 NAD(P)H-hydrate dehydratase [Deltaproteobacteria bacterium]HOS26559.1 NAD(P)H-hydrate dehydratase [Deltaproteobacteria bacterium]HPL85832.1 NAD(P)H-hydrate dehydratase [Deltaproteobacteria bacterium]
MKVSSVGEMRAMDRSAVETYGIAELLLMENAGLAACTVLERELGIRGRTFLIFCGGGNNGGDGFVAARKILSAGGTPEVFILGDPGKYRGAARTNFDILNRLPVAAARLDSPEKASDALSRCDAVVDALLGTGIDREVTGLYAETIRMINGSGKPVLSLDIPSGVNGDTGREMGDAIEADYTVTFGLPKIGNLLMPGNALCGRLFVTHISFPPELYAAPHIRIEINDPPALPPRDPQGHKGTFGEALFIGGSAGYYGAPYFSALSFLKAGGGYSRLACPERVAPFIAAKGSEVVFIPQKQTPAGSISYENKNDLLASAARMDIVIIGPGLSLNEESAQLARELAAAVDRPLIIDADGITAVCKDIGILKKRTAPTVLTPHLGEMSRMTGLKVDHIDADKIAVLTKTSRELGSIIVLKGARTLIGYPDGRVLINLSGNCGMATAGSGDVLTGTIAAMLGLGLDIENAVAKGVFIHGVSGDIAAADLGQDGMTAQDILENLPRALMMDRARDLDSLYPGITTV